MANNDTPYIYLVSFTSKGRAQDEKTIHDDHKRVTDLIQISLGGTCTLYTVPGLYDFVSLVTGITADGAIQVQQEIEKKGFAKALLLPTRKADK